MFEDQSWQFYIHLNQCQTLANYRHFSLDYFKFLSEMNEAAKRISIKMAHIEEQ